MNTKITAATARLAKALRAEANEQVEASTYISIIARLLEGKTLDEAMGAPGDWGYDTPIGDAVYALLNEEGHAPRLTVPDDVTAAAPELLAALELADAIFTRFGAAPEECDADVGKAWLTIRAALRAAKGGK